MYRENDDGNQVRSGVPRLGEYVHPAPSSFLIANHSDNVPSRIYSVMSSEAALSLLHVPSLPPLAQHGGILTPSTALGDVIVKRLSEAGYWEIASTVVQHPDN